MLTTVNGLNTVNLLTTDNLLNNTLTAAILRTILYYTIYYFAHYSQCGVNIFTPLGSDLSSSREMLKKEVRVGAEILFHSLCGGACRLSIGLRAEYSKDGSTTST